MAVWIFQWSDIASVESKGVNPRNQIDENHFTFSNWPYSTGCEAFLFVTSFCETAFFVTFFSCSCHRNQTRNTYFGMFIFNLFQRQFHLICGFWPRLVLFYKLMINCYSIMLITDRSKAVVPMLFLFCVALQFTLRGVSCLGLSCSLSTVCISSAL